jgi:amidase
MPILDVDRPLAFAPAVELLELLRSGQMSARELLDLYLGRIGSREPELGAVVTVDGERAMAAAAAADEARAGGDDRPLLGLPVTVKDSLETAGLRTTAGAAELSGHVPAGDAVAVARLRAAGAVVVGKTNLPAWAGDVQSHNRVFGTTANPWDRTRTAGGSSGGSAAAVAAGLTGLELGSDIGGSIRTPAAWCGVFGHKPTFGIVPVEGHLPPPPGVLSPMDMAVVGPLARSAADLSLALDVVAGPHGDDAVLWSLRLPPPRAERLGDFRVGLWLDDPRCAVSTEVGAALEGAAGALAAAGATVVPLAGAAAAAGLPAPSLARLTAPYQALLQAAMAVGLPDAVFAGLLATAEGAAPGDDSEAVRHARLVTARVRDWQRAQEERAGIRRWWAGLFGGGAVDVVLAPAVPTVAIPHDHRRIRDRRLVVDGEERPYWDVLLWASPANLAYLPASALPVGFSADGLPVGAQIIGAHGGDRTTLAFAACAEEVLGGFVPPPDR